MTSLRPQKPGALREMVIVSPLSGMIRERHQEALNLILIALVLVLGVSATAPAQAADLEAGRRKSEPCARCHGPDGNATITGTPSLAGQPAWFTHWTLIKFRDGRRPRRDPTSSPGS